MATTSTTRNAEAVQVNPADLETKTRDELISIAKELGLSGYHTLKKHELLRLLQSSTERKEEQGRQERQGGNLFSGGILEVTDEGYGFLRGESLLPGLNDIYVSQSQVRRFGLRTGDLVTGQIRPPKEQEKYYGLLRVEAVNGLEPEVAKRRPYFESLTPIFPLKMINLEVDPRNLSARLVNLIAPIGRGQRGLIVSPPKAGKTTIYNLTPAEQAQWRQVLLPVHKQMESRIGKDLIQAIARETAKK